MTEREKLEKQVREIKGVINHLTNLHNTQIDLEAREDNVANQLKIIKIKFDIARCQRNLDNMVKEVMGINHYNNNVETIRPK